MSLKNIMCLCIEAALNLYIALSKIVTLDFWEVDLHLCVLNAYR